MGIADLTDDELRHQLFERLYARLQAEQHKDPAVLLFNRTPIAFWSSRHGAC
jgi:hypothetical protein